MKTDEFYRKYANTPIANRLISLNMKGDSLESLYREIDRLQNEMRPRMIYQQSLIDEAEKGFKALKAAKDKTFK
jgi:hypothetical protein